MKYSAKDIAVRALKTFIQGFIGALVVTLPNSDYTDISVIKSILVGAIAGGVSAVMNLIYDYIKKDVDGEETENNV